MAAVSHFSILVLASTVLPVVALLFLRFVTARGDASASRGMKAVLTRSVYSRANDVPSQRPLYCGISTSQIRAIILLTRGRSPRLFSFHLIHIIFRPEYHIRLIFISTTGPLHTAISLPLFGDSTQNQAIIFSAALPLPLPSIPSPTFPNYTLPPADLAYPPPPDGVQFAGLNVTLVMAPTNGSPAGASMSACALRRLQGAREVGSEGAQVGAGTGEARLIVRGEEGWRVQWLIEGLEPQTNYTAYVIEGGTKVGGPIWFVTKDGRRIACDSEDFVLTFSTAAFSCTLLHTLPFCPRVSYAIPLSPPAGSSATSLDSTNLDPAITAPILEYMTNFTASLLTFACGRDWYSPVQTCESCQRTYRDWLCAVSFPRCGEAVPPSQAQPDTDAQRPLSRPRPALLSQTPQTPLSASQLARNPALAALSSFASQSWTALLPCLETCHAVDRACPDFLGFRCPVPRFTAARSYGVGYVDGDGNGEVGGGKGDWVQGGGAVGVAQDRWGNVWCNG